MATATIHSFTVFEGSGATLMARVQGNDGQNIKQADLTAITCKVFDKTDATNVATPSITVSAVIFDTLQTDDRWTVDVTGYNFRHEQLASVFSGGGRIYRIEYKFDPGSGEDFFVIFEGTTIPVFTS